LFIANVKHEKEALFLLSAMRKNGELFQLYPRLSREMLREEKEKEEFYCPECKEKVIMKMGMQRMEHFAHRKGSQCIESYERESSYHLQGKLHLFQWLQSQKLNPVLEPYFKSIQQRPDISFSSEFKPFAIEYQCSTIPPELMIKRTKHYQKINCTPLWILGGKNIKRKGEKKVSLTNFEYLFVSKSSSGSWYLPAYCPESKIFILLSDLSPISSKNALSHISIIPYQKFSFRMLSEIPNDGSLSSEVWKKEMQNQKLNYLRQYHHNEFLRELYKVRLNISLLPPYIGLPVPNALFIETAPLIWQSYLFIDQIINKNAGERITFNNIYKSFLKRVDKKQIKLRTLPLVPNRSCIAPLSEYLHLLVDLNILQSINTNTFVMRQKAMIPEHFVQQQEIEDQFYKEYGKKLFK
jgi:competence protein CoiA